MYRFISGISLKDYLILVSLGLLVVCILEIRKLKKRVTKEIHRLLTPQLSMFMIPGLDKDAGIYVQNDSSFLVRNLRIEETEFVLEDFGFNIHCIAVFEPVDFIKPRERVKLGLSIVNKKHEPMPKLTGAAIPHLVAPSFKVTARYSNIENVGFKIVFAKKRDQFTAEGFEQIEPPESGQDRQHKEAA
jgi:hypothetical protein